MRHRQTDGNRRYANAPQTIGKALAILNCFSLDEPELTAAEIGQRLGLTNSTLYRYLYVMENEGYIEQDPLTNRYFIGLRIVELAGIGLGRLDVRRHSQVELDSLANVLEMNATLGVLYQGDTFHLAFAVRTEVDKMYAVIGRRTPAHCTAIGKVILAHLPRNEVHEMMERFGWRPMTENSICSHDAIDIEFDKVALDGWAMDKGESNPRAWCVAAPVYEQGGRIVAAIGVTAQKECVESNLDQVVREVCVHAERLSMRLGYTGRFSSFI